MSKIRDRLSAVWRWPLYSRRRAVSLVLGALLVGLVWPRVMAGHTTNPSDVDAAGNSTVTAAVQSATQNPAPAGTSFIEMSGSTSSADTDTDAVDAAGETSNADPGTESIQPPSMTSAGSVSAPSVGGVVITPGSTPPASTAAQVSTAGPTGGPGYEQLSAPPPAPRLTGQPGDYATPAAAAAQYLAVWCAQPAAGAANQNLANEAPWVTAAGWADDKTRAVTDQSWARTQQAGLSTTCARPTVTLMAEAPNTTTLQWVQISARQATVNRAGQLVGQQTITQTRRILRAPDGRWLVDVQVQAG